MPERNVLRLARTHHGSVKSVCGTSPSFSGDFFNDADATGLLRHPHPCTDLARSEFTLSLRVIQESCRCPHLSVLEPLVKPSRDKLIMMVDLFSSSAWVVSLLRPLARSQSRWLHRCWGFGHQHPHLRIRSQFTEPLSWIAPSSSTQAPTSNAPSSSRRTAGDHIAALV